MPNVPYPRYLFEYLTEIAEHWTQNFGQRNNVTVSELVDLFDRLVSQDLINAYGNKATEWMIPQFHRGALKAQPKIGIINEKNRTHFHVPNDQVKRLFVYPQFPDGEYRGVMRWPDLIIKPIQLLTPAEREMEFVIFWKDRENQVRTSTL